MVRCSAGACTLVDEENGKAMIIEECSAKGPVEWMPPTVAALAGR